MARLNALLREPQKKHRQPVATAGVTRTLAVVDAAPEGTSRRDRP
ncbi:hypothetical protein ACFUJY_25165 [Streptomyces sp. NPDC057249]